MVEQISILLRPDQLGHLILMQIGFVDFEKNGSSFFANMSFLFLFFAMTFYWVDFVFSEGRIPINSPLVFNKGLIDASNLEAQSKRSNLFNINFQFNKNFFENLGKYAILLGNLSLICLLCVRWKESGHFPLSNLYESLMFLSWCCTSIHLLLLYTLEEKKTIQTSNLFSGLQKYSVSAPQGPLVVFPLPLENQEPFDNSAVPFSPWEKTKGPLAFGFPRAKGKLAEPYPGLFPTPFGGGEYKELELQNENQRSENQRGNGLKNGKPLEKLVGSILAPCALFLNSFATFSLPKEMQQAGPLVPALQSNWLMMHVTVMIISYAALILGSLLSVAFLIFTSFVRSSHHPEGKTMDATFDYLSYRIIGIGFPFLTIGILSGAVWANEAWGSYWSWDPKETWALLTWLIFAIYLHTRLTKGWQGEKPALIASVGFVVVWICYLGVNLLGEGLHSYGFLSK